MLGTHPYNQAEVVLFVLERLLTWDLGEGKTFQNLSVSSPAPVTIVWWDNRGNINKLKMGNEIPLWRKGYTFHQVPVHLVRLQGKELCKYAQWELLTA